MTGTEVLTLVTALVAIIAMIGGVIVRDRQVSKMISDGDERLHQRINQVRDEYVKRADLDGHLARIDKNIENMRQDLREASSETNRRLDSVIGLLGVKERKG